MTKHATLQQIFEIARDNAARIFAKDHCVMPIWHIVAGNGENMVIATPWSDDNEKEVALFLLRNLFAERSARRFVFVCEAWMAELPADTPSQEAMQTSASEHPDRREAIRITAEDRSGETMSGHFFILRPEHGPPKLSPFHKDDDTIALGGRLAGMLT